MQPFKVFVGTDRSQLLAVKVLEHSIKANTKMPVEVVPMCDLPVPTPKKARNFQRTGFSFSRFCIPKFMNYQGRALYLDADMLVFGDIAELLEWPMGDHKIIIQKPLDGKQSNTTGKIGAPKKRIRQCSVMLLDCSKLDWDVEKIIQGLDDESFNYEQLMFELCLLKEEDIGEELPFQWNSLEHYDATTKLIHYTDMKTQPWVNPDNRNADVWYEELRRMLADGSLKFSDLYKEIELGYFRPSLTADVYGFKKIPKLARPVVNNTFKLVDRLLGFKPHKEVYARSSKIKKALRAEAAAAPAT